MSEHTPEAASHGSDGADNGNPSMEDILASIRRIIADDATDTQADSAVSAETDINAQVGHTEQSINQDELIIGAEADALLDDIMELDDVLILDDEAFNEDDLKIPGDDLINDALTTDNSLDVDIVSGDASADDMTAIDLNAMLSETVTEPDVDALTAPAPSIEANELVELAEPKVELTNTTPSAMDAPNTDMLDPGLDDSIFAALDHDIDLIIEDERPATTDSEDGTTILSTISPAPAPVDAPPNPYEMDAVQPDVTTEDNSVKTELVDTFVGDDDDNFEDLNDLMATLLTDDFGDDDTPDQTILSEMPALTPETPTEVGADTDEDDIELVKSLMAELTDGDLLGDDLGGEAAEGQDALITPDPAQPATDPATAQADDTPDGESIDDVLDDILDLALEDEEMAADAQGDIHGDVFDPAIEDIDATINSLLEIAAAAKQDADIVSEPEPPVVLDVMPSHETAALTAEEDDDAGIDIDAIFSDTLITEDDTLTEASAVDDELTDVIVTPTIEPTKPKPVDPNALAIDALVARTKELRQRPPQPKAEPKAEPETVAETITPKPEPVLAAVPDPKPAPEPQPAPEKETSKMSKLAINDSILDEVTEAAASDAFATLNQLVEEKTEYEESGPRIGDLVQDALRPMLKEWLDEHLKDIVSRAVDKEVKRIASGK